jgi:hypothetical protein
LPSDTDAKEVTQQSESDQKPEELVGKWRSEADAYPEAVDPRAEAAATAVRLCAEELEEALAGDEDD